MIWTVVLWLGMQGQAQDEAGNFTVDKSQMVLQSPRCDENTWISIRRADDSMDKIAICGNDGIYHRLADDKPANHVFEIRIGLRVGTRKLGYCFPAYQGDITKQKCGEVLERDGCPSGAICSPVAQLIRELWMDGVKLGILKGLD